jgi:hypothetical protein
MGICSQLVRKSAAVEEMNSKDFDREYGLEYIIPSEIKLTELEVKMFEKNGIRVYDVEKMSRQELQDAYEYFVKMGM